MNKVNGMVNSCVAYLVVAFFPEPLYMDDLENMLDEAMLSLNTMTEDGSIEEVCLIYTIFKIELLELNSLCGGQISFMIMLECMIKAPFFVAFQAD